MYDTDEDPKAEQEYETVTNGSATSNKGFVTLEQNSSMYFYCSKRCAWHMKGIALMFYLKLVLVIREIFPLK